MSRAPSLFRQSDLVRAYRAAAACGHTVTRTEFTPDGRFVLVLGPEPAPVAEISELEVWRAKRNARSS